MAKAPEPIVKKIPLAKINKLNESDKLDAQEEIKEYIIDTILDHVSKSESPVNGGKWKSDLSPKYKKIKAKISGSSKPNMELYGGMLDDLKASFDEKGNLYVGFGGEAGEAKPLSMLKAENHNKFTSEARKTKVPQRDFIPKSNRSFLPEIMQDINDIIDSYLEGDEGLDI